MNKPLQQTIKFKAMTLKKEIIPKWKEKEDRKKKSSFDESIGILGINKRFREEKDTKEKEQEKEAVS